MASEGNIVLAVETRGFRHLRELLLQLQARISGRPPVQRADTATPACPDAVFYGRSQARTMWPPGHSLVELLLVVAMLGLLASLAIPPYLGSLHQAKRTETAATLRAIGQAWQSWRLDQHGAIPAGRGRHFAGELRPVAHERLVEALVPHYLPDVPAVDAWGNALAFVAAREPHSPAQMAICSGGRDGRPAACPGGELTSESPAGDYGADIIWTPGALLYRPGAAGTPGPPGSKGWAPPDPSPWLEGDPHTSTGG